MKFEQIPYVLNVMILLPIAVPALFGWFAADQRAFDESEGWRKIAGAMWLSILILSIFGLFNPERFMPILAMQVIYKTLWIATYALPCIIRREHEKLPVGITTSFLVIVLVYPFFIPWQQLLFW